MLDRHRSLSALATVALLVPGLAAQLVTTYPTREYPVPFRPMSVEVADFDGDSLPDLLTSSLQDKNSAVLLARCEGGYFPAVAYATTSVSLGIAVDDLDGDGDLDYVVTDAFASQLQVRTNDGSGGFATSHAFGSGAGLFPTGVALGDVDGDLLLDAVVAHAYGAVTVLVGDGTGAFTLTTTIAIPGTNSGIVSVGDFDSDSWLDCVTSGIGGSMEVLLGSSSGFGTPTAYATLATAQSPLQQVADLDGDGNLDVLLPRYTKLILMLGDGAGAFAAGTPIVLSATNEMQGAAFGDMDGDGVGDILVGDNDTSGVAWLRGLGSGTWASPVITPVGGAPGAVRVADLDGDGTLDLVTPTQTGSALTVALNTGGGSLSEPVTVPGGSGNDIIVADMDGDAKNDVIVSDAQAGAIRVHKGNAAGAFAAPVTSSVGAPPRMVAFEATGDARVDVIGSDPIAGSVLLYAGDGAGGLVAPLSFLTAGGCSDVLAADVNGDATTDVVALNQGSDSVSVLRGTGTTLLAATTFAVHAGAVGIALTTLDPGSVPDLVTANTTGSTANSVGTWIGDGSGGFTFLASHAVPEPVVELAAGDLTADGNGDVVLVAQDGTVYVMVGNGSGGFGTPVPYELGKYQFSADVLLEDVDGNGLLDVVVADTMAANVTVLPGDGTGVLGQRVPFTTGHWPVAVAAGLLDGDALPDLVTANSGVHGGTQPVSVLINEPIQFCPWPAGQCTGLAGIFGIPLLAGNGSLVPGTVGSLTLTGAAPWAAALLFVSTTSQPTAFKCGLLCPWPPILILGLMTNASGAIPIAWSSWPSGPHGYTLYVQYAIKDAAATCGASLSNSLQVFVP